MDDVEKLAEEIEEKCSIEGWKDSNGRGCDSCICSEKVARFVLRREIEARLEEHNLTCKICKRPAMYNSGGTYCDRLAELHKQLIKIGE